MKTAQAIKLAGNAYRLAKLLGIRPQSVAEWKEDVPPLRVYQLREKRPEWFTTPPGRPREAATA